jgi:hypothetical protein
MFGLPQSFFSYTTCLPYHGMICFCKIQLSYIGKVLIVVSWIHIACVGDIQHSWTCSRIPPAWLTGLFYVATTLHISPWQRRAAVNHVVSPFTGDSTPFHKNVVNKNITVGISITDISIIRG